MCLSSWSCDVAFFLAELELHITWFSHCSSYCHWGILAVMCLGVLQSFSFSCLEQGKGGWEGRETRVKQYLFSWRPRGNLLMGLLGSSATLIIHTVVLLSESYLARYKICSEKSHSVGTKCPYVYKRKKGLCPHLDQQLHHFFRKFDFHLRVGGRQLVKILLLPNPVPKNSKGCAHGFGLGRWSLMS